MVNTFLAANCAKAYQNQSEEGTPMDKPAPVDHPVHDIVRERWSPRAFADRPIDQQVLDSLLEAARWSPSARNSQPWRFLVAHRADADEFARLLDCLVPGNRRWARSAAVLLVAVALGSDHKGRQLIHGAYDTGQAVAWLTAEATARGIRVHQMGGFDPDRVRQSYGVPDHARPMTAVALGYPTDPDCLDDDLRAQELAPRERRPLTQLVFRRAWGEPV
jgi:nitroreductase